MSGVNLNQWEEATVREVVSIEDLDAAVKDYSDARKEYEDKKKISNEAELIQKEKKRVLLDLLERSGKSNWEVDGLGKASVTTKYNVPTPKTMDDKEKFASYLKDKYGEEVFWNLFSVNSKTLGSFYNQELEQDPSTAIPGIQAPVAEKNISFRKKQ